MKRAVAILLLLLLWITAMRPFSPYLAYSLRRAYIAERLCVNRDLPALRCEGRCQLRLQLQALAEGQTLHAATPKPPAKVPLVVFTPTADTRLAVAEALPSRSVQGSPPTALHSRCALAPASPPPRRA